MLDLVDFVVPPPAADMPGVCRICRDYAGAAPICRTCDDYRAMGFAPPAPVEPISLYDGDSPLRHSLVGYKNSNEPHRHPYARAIGRVVDSFFAHHLHRLHATHGPIDGAVVVPSTQGRPRHPLHTIVAAGSSFGGRSMVLEPLAPTTMGIPRRHLNPTAFAPSGDVDVDGLSLLLIDDVYCSGATAQSVAAALYAAGAHVNCIVAIGRRLNPAVHPGIARLYATQQRLDPRDWLTGTEPHTSAA